MLAIQMCQREVVKCFLSVKVLDNKKKKSYAEIAKLYGKNKSSTPKIVKKEIHAFLLTQRGHIT